MARMSKTDNSNHLFAESLFIALSIDFKESKGKFIMVYQIIKIIIYIASSVGVALFAIAYEQYNRETRDGDKDKE